MPGGDTLKELIVSPIDDYCFKRCNIKNKCEKLEKLLGLCGECDEWDFGGLNALMDDD